VSKFVGVATASDGRGAPFPPAIQPLRNAVTVHVGWQDLLGYAAWSGRLVWTVLARGRLGAVHDDGWTEALTGYAERLHAAAGPDHHVVSALGAWMLVALCAPQADEEGRGELAELVGADRCRRLTSRRSW